VSSRNHEAVFRLAAKVAQNCDENEFVTALLEGELPVLKLTPAEMEVSKGGSWTDPFLFLLNNGLISWP